MNHTTDQSYGHAVPMPSKHAGKPERSKNPRLNLLYTYYSFPAACNNYLVSAASIFLNLSSLNPCQPHRAIAASKKQPEEDFFELSLIFKLVRDNLRKTYLGFSSGLEFTRGAIYYSTSLSSFPYSSSSAKLNCGRIYSQMNYLASLCTLSELLIRLLISI